MTDLLPCPFCGSAPVTNRRGTNIIGQIYCRSDDCFGPRTTAVCYEDSVAQWNTRAHLHGEPQGALDRDVIAEAICEPGYRGHFRNNSAGIKWQCQQAADRVILALSRPHHSSQGE